MPVVAGRGRAEGSRGVRDRGRYSDLQVKEGAERIIGVVDFIEVILEGIEVTTLEHDTGAAHLWTVIGHKLFDRWPVVEVVEQGVAGVLLTVERDGEGNGLLDDIRVGRMALNVARVEYFSVRRLGTEAASCFFAKINEILTPNLDGSVSILRAVSRVEGIDPSRLIIGEQSFIDTILEISSDRDLESYFGIGERRRRVIAL